MLGQPKGRCGLEPSPLIYADRREAGRCLARLLADVGLAHAVVVALPRGGVPVGAEVARVLRAPLDVLSVRKLRAPGRPELAIGAVADGAESNPVFNADLIRELGVEPDELEREIAEQTDRLHRLDRAIREGRPPVPVGGKDVVLVDDGLATGATARAAIHRLRRDSVRSLTLAVPVSPADTLADLRDWVDRIVCPLTPADFQAVGHYYRDFDPVSEDQVRAFLRNAAC